MNEAFSWGEFRGPRATERVKQETLIINCRNLFDYIGDRHNTNNFHGRRYRIIEGSVYRGRKNTSLIASQVTSGRILFLLIYILCLPLSPSNIVLVLSSSHGFLKPPNATAVSRTNSDKCVVPRRLRAASLTYATRAAHRRIAVLQAFLAGIFKP